MIEHRELLNGGFVEVEPRWLPSTEAEMLHAALVRELAWEQRDIVLFGKRIPQPRLIAWAGDVPYTYSGQTLEPRAAPPSLRDITVRVAERVNVPFNHVLVNRYRDGKDSMGMHSDDEAELGRDPVIVSLSLGASRRFVLVPRRGNAARNQWSASLDDGSLLVMGGTCQAHYRHGIPKMTGVIGERVSLTFRRVVVVPT